MAFELVLGLVLKPRIELCFRRKSSALPGLILVAQTHPIQLCQQGGAHSTQFMAVDAAAGAGAGAHARACSALNAPASATFGPSSGDRGGEEAGCWAVRCLSAFGFGDSAVSAALSPRVNLDDVFMRDSSTCGSVWHANSAWGLRGQAAQARPQAPARAACHRKPGAYFGHTESDTPPEADSGLAV